ncbi:MAG: SCO family protein [Actinomycetota bacterium]|nr:SCO family protein [Actinomycetota bacterium]
MPARVRLAVVVAAALLLALSGAALLAQARGGDEGTQGPGSPFAGALRPPGVPPAELRGLRDQDGRPVSLRELRGQPVVVTFLYTSCEDTCPLTAQQVRGALDDLGRDVPALAVSVDPANDTPERARRFLRRQGLQGRMRYLLGDRPALARQWRAYGIQPQGDGFEHSAHVVLLDGRGVQRIGFPVSRLDPEALAHDLRVLSDGARAAPAS